MLKRANARMTIFETDDDYAAFERILAQAVERFEIQLLYYCDIQPGEKRGQVSFDKET